MSVIVKAKIKEIAVIDEKSFNVSSDFADALAVKVESIIKEACRRASANSRSTIMAKDL